ncbi:hypothetical protein NX059_009745 [Plenodomus lindquistii]|nr:hypothetical protein NX059_009745 [Plenodomus lindquistii]
MARLSVAETRGIGRRSLPVNISNRTQPPPLNGDDFVNDVDDDIVGDPTYVDEDDGGNDDDYTSDEPLLARAGRRRAPASDPETPDPTPKTKRTSYDEQKKQSVQTLKQEVAERNVKITWTEVATGGGTSMMMHYSARGIEEDSVIIGRGKQESAMLKFREYAKLGKKQRKATLAEHGNSLKKMLKAAS